MEALGVSHVALGASESESADEDGGLTNDQIDMKRMGRKQVFNRIFNAKTCFFLILAAGPDWVPTAFYLDPGLIDGGRSVLIISTLVHFVFFFPVYISMGEMASMAPITGAQYHWTSELAPERLQKILSYITGWFSALAWQSAQAASCLLTGTLVLDLVSIADPTYSAAPWQGWLITLLLIWLGVLFNVVYSKWLPHLTIISVLIQLPSMIFLTATLWVYGQHASAKEVFVNLENIGGWSSLATAILVGQSNGIAIQVGQDTSTHVAEEVRNAARTIPISMLLGFVVNCAVAILVQNSVSFAITNVSKALSDPSGYALVSVLRERVPVWYQIVVLGFPALILFLSNVSYVAPAARELYAFCRDKGFPCHEYLGKIDSKRHVPVRALICSGVFSSCLTAIYIWNEVAFEALVSVANVGILPTYAVPIACILWRRIYHSDTLEPTYFSMGRKFGITMNSIALLELIWCIFWSFWPLFPGFNTNTFNWACVVFVFVFLVSFFWYLFKARHEYDGPVKLTKKRT